tara:strand:+ start:199 stop:675 length:477 start_codon:yes stop_codon:yes gene_type:complete
MSKRREQSAIDAIYELTRTVDTIDKRLTVIDSNIKLLNNKVAKLTKSLSARDGLSTTIENSTGPQVVSREKKESTLVLGNTTAYGYIVDQDKKPMVGVYVDVLNGAGEVIKDVTTDKNGYWSVRLPHGKYEVRYKMKGFKATSRIMDIKKGEKKYEVR